MNIPNLYTHFPVNRLLGSFQVEGISKKLLWASEDIPFLNIHNFTKAMKIPIAPVVPCSMKFQFCSICLVLLQKLCFSYF